MRRFPLRESLTAGVTVLGLWVAGCSAGASPSPDQKAEMVLTHDIESMANRAYTLYMDAPPDERRVDGKMLVAKIPLLGGGVLRIASLDPSIRHEQISTSDIMGGDALDIQSYRHGQEIFELSFWYLPAGIVNITPFNVSKTTTVPSWSVNCLSLYPGRGTPPADETQLQFQQLASEAQEQNQTAFIHDATRDRWPAHMTPDQFLVAMIARANFLLHTARAVQGGDLGAAGPYPDICVNNDSR